MTPTHTDIFSTADLEGLTGDDLQMKQDLFAIYCSESPRLAADLDRALLAGDAKAVAYAAHAMRSLTSTVGGRALFDLCGVIEHSAHEGDLAHASALNATVAESIEALRQAFARYLAEEAPPSR